MMIDNDSLLALASMAWKPTLLLIMAWVIHLALGSRRSLIQSTLGNAVVLGLLVLPLTIWIFPRLRCEVWSAETASISTPSEPEVVVDSSNEEIPTLMDFKPPPSLVFKPMNLESSGPIVIEQPEISATQNPLTFQMTAEQIALSVYGLVAVFLGLRLIMGCLAVTTLQKSAALVTNPLWLEQLQHWTATLGIALQPRLLASNRVSSPMALGWWKPCIVIPASMLNVKSLSMIDAVLIHELAHIKRKDYAWNLALKTLEIVYWPHPLAWVYAKTLSTTREQVCDELCIHHLGGNTVYRTSLLNVAEMMLARPRTSLGLMMANGTKLGRRLKRIAQGEGASRCLLGRGARLVVALVALVLTGVLGTLEFAQAAMSDSGDPQVKTVESSQAATCEIIVKDQASGKPLAGASVRLSFQVRPQTWKTDEQGRVLIPIMPNMLDPSSMTICVWGNSHVEQKHEIAISYQNNKPVVPKPLMVGLWPGQTIGGKIVNEQGKPVVGAEIMLSGEFDPSERKKDEERFVVYGLKTDEQGRWRFGGARKLCFLTMKVYHRDYVDFEHTPGELRERSDDPRAINLETYFNQTEVHVLKKGVSLPGRVLDLQGKPVTNAVLHIADFLSIQRKPGVPADDQGHFVLHANARSNHQTIAVAQAAGYSPAIIKVPDLNNPGELVFRLHPGRILRGRVVDSQGNPLPGAFLESIDSKNQIRSMRLTSLTDAEGRFELKDAIVEPFQLHATKFGWAALNSVQIRPEDQDVTLTLNPSTTTQFRFRDEKTNNVILFDQIVAEYGVVDSKTREEKWLRVRPGYVYNGEFAWRSNLANQTYRLRFRLPGYETYTTDPINGTNRPTRSDIILKKSPPGAQIQVLNEANKPVENAEVSLATADYPLVLRPSRSLGQTNAPKSSHLLALRTDSQGHCTLPLLNEAFKMVVIHNQGYAFLKSEDLQRSGKVQLRSWGRIRGRLVLGNEPVANQNIVLKVDRPQWESTNWKGVSGVDANGKATRIQFYLAPSVQFMDFETTTDAEGNFVFERMIPANMVAYYWPNKFGLPHATPPPLDDPLLHKQLLEVKPGQTTVTTIVRQGRPVVGRLVLPKDNPNAVNWRREPHSMFLIPSVWPDYPVFQGKTPSEEEALFERWWNSAEGKAVRRKQVDSPRASVSADGSFRINHALPGTYGLSLGDGDSEVFFFKIITVPDLESEWSDEPLDLGQLQVGVRVRLKVGEAAPPLEWTLSDGSRKSLKDYRGKYVLLNSLYDLGSDKVYDDQVFEQMKSIETSLRSNPRFVSINIVPKQSATPKPQMRDWPGVRAEFEPDSPTDPPNPYDFVGFFSVLIDPQGKVVDKLQRNQIHDVVIKAVNGK